MAMGRTSESIRASVITVAPRSVSTADFVALEAVLGVLAAPALIVRQSGKIVCSNSATCVFISNAPDTLRGLLPATETAGFPLETGRCRRSAAPARMPSR